MKNRTLAALLLLAVLLFAGSCAGRAERAAARAAARARAEAAEQALKTIEAEAALTPEQKLEALYERNPALKRKAVSIGTRRDTVRVAGAAAALQLAPAADAQADRALADTLLAVLKQLHVTDSALTDAHAQAAAAQLARRLGAARPTYPRDTQRVVVDGLELSVWMDKAGKVHAQAQAAPKKIAVTTELLEVQPIRAATVWESLGLAVKLFAGLAALGLLLVLFFLYRKRQANAEREQNRPPV